VAAAGNVCRYTNPAAEEATGGSGEVPIFAGPLPQMAGDDTTTAERGGADETGMLDLYLAPS